jgi:hypothetical protein
MNTVGITRKKERWHPKTTPYILESDFVMLLLKLLIQGFWQILIAHAVTDEVLSVHCQ